MNPGEELFNRHSIEAFGEFLKVFMTLDGGKFEMGVAKGTTDGEMALYMDAKGTACVVTVDNVDTAKEIIDSLYENFPNPNLRVLSTEIDSLVKMIQENALPGYEGPTGTVH